MKVDLKALTSNSTAASSSARSTREIIESIVVAFVLAFMFRTFEAEAFVIPTGSMAPTLQGRHKDIDCPKCSHEYRVSASREVADGENQRVSIVQGAMCPMCGYHVDVDLRKPDNQFYSHSGDRILVGKFAYEFKEPERWDVIVFKNPDRAQINFIKRLIGLPGETLRISGGDIFTRPLGADPSEPFKIERKPVDKLLAMLQTVYSSKFVSDELNEWGFPARWQPAGSPEADAQAGEWKSDDGYRSYSVEAAEETRWLRYSHLLPDVYDWRLMTNNQPPRRVDQQLILDYYAYNSGEDGGGMRDDSDRWVGDLGLQTELEVQSSEGTITLELIKAGERFLCHVDVATGEARLESTLLPDFAPRAATGIRGPGKYEVLFTNVDQELRLFVDGEAVEFDSPTTYDPPRPLDEPTQADLSPAAIGAENASVRVSDVTLLRDVYYTPRGHRRGMDVIEDPMDFDLQAFPNDSGRDQFFALGDNSPASKDSRLWETQHHVDRDLLIGKALWIYWPHALRKRVGEYWVPYFPNFARMGFVR